MLIAQRIHPQTIIAGYRKATDAAWKALENSAKDHGCVITSANACLMSLKYLMCQIVLQYAVMTRKSFVKI